MDPAELTDHLVGLSQRVDTLSASLQEVRLENDTLRNRLNQIVPPHRDRPEPKVCPPEPFSGDRRLFRHFVSSCQLMFELQPHTYYSDRIRILTLVSYLKEDPRVWADTYVEEHGELLGSFNTFLGEMSLLYEDSNKQLTAENTLRNLKQGYVTLRQIRFRFMDRNCGDFSGSNPGFTLNSVKSLGSIITASVK